ncbi:Papain family cysteine protease [Ruminococcaceae bacterium FB2012]|nr:Papain family cysteine protease [Ruminococcaceae bacterium FB2012]
MRTKKIVSAAAALMMLACAAQPAAFTSFAEDGAPDAELSYEEKLDKLGRSCAASMIDTDYAPTIPGSDITVPAPALRKFDLRDVDGKNYVTPVKDQRNAPNCWAFTATACLETDLLYELGIDLNECDESVIPDFSERQFAWFVAAQLGENSLYPSQTGEGTVRYAAYLEMLKEDPDLKLIFNEIFTGGDTDNVLSMLSTGQGPVDESLVPNLDDVYMSGTVTIYEVINDPDVCEDTEDDPLFDKDKEEKIPFSSKAEFLEIISDETLLGRIVRPAGGSYWYVGNGRYWDYSADGEAPKDLDWSVDEAYRFSDYTIENFNCMQRLAAKDPDTGEYYFDENVLNCMKNEILNGRAVALSLNYVSTGPTDENRRFNYIDKNGEITDNQYKCDSMCYYCYDADYDPDDPESINKTLSANHSVTVVGYDDDFPKEYFYDPKGTLKGNGAFIAKNSWGSRDTYKYFGNNGDGYFYISYYDQSLGLSPTMDLKLPDPDGEEEEKLSVSFEHQYDLMNSLWVMTCREDEIASANVYKCEYDQKLVSLGMIYSHPNNTVKYDVYILNDDPSGPTDGTLAASMTVSGQYAGYHNTDLPEPVYMKKGTSFSVVVTSECRDGKQEIIFKDGLLEAKAMQQYEDDKAKYTEEHGSEEGFIPYSLSFCRDIVNRGESFVYYEGEWFDWVDVREGMRSCGVRPDHAGTDLAENTAFDNFAIHAYTEYAYFSADHRIKEPQDEPYNPGDEVVCTVTLTKELNKETGSCDVFAGGRLIGSLDELAPGESAEFEYTYTVTESDLERGYFENTVQVYTMAYDGSYLEFELLDALNNTTVRAYVTAPEPDDSSESEPDSESESEPDSSSESESDSEPDSTSDSEPEKEKAPPKEDSSDKSDNPKTGAASGAAVIAAAAVLGTILVKKRS